MMRPGKAGKIKLARLAFDELESAAVAGGATSGASVSARICSRDQRGLACRCDYKGLSQSFLQWGWMRTRLTV